MVSKVERIIYNGKIFALILRAEKKIEGVEFFTPKNYPFQMGVHIREKGTEIKPHTHKPISRTITTTQEMIHVDYGKVMVDFFNEDLKKITSTILNPGDTVLLVSGGHSFKILEKTKMIEVKQGPYENVEKDKIKFK